MRAIELAAQQTVIEKLAPLLGVEAVGVVSKVSAIRKDRIRYKRERDISNRERDVLRKENAQLKEENARLKGMKESNEEPPPL